MEKEVIVAVALGIGLSASCGFRVFLPLLAAAIAARLGIFPVHEGFQWLGSWAAIICFGTATLIEIGAYYIPFIDNLLDTIATPLAIGAGTLLFTSILPMDEHMLKWIIGLIAGGGAAATIQGGTVMARLASSKLTAGSGNSVVATLEHAAAIVTSVISFLAPVFIAAAIIIVIVVILVKFRRKTMIHKS